MAFRRRDAPTPTFLQDWNLNFTPFFFLLGSLIIFFLFDHHFLWKCLITCFPKFWPVLPSLFSQSLPKNFLQRINLGNLLKHLPHCLYPSPIVISIHKGILFNHKEKEILPFARTWMNLEDVMLIETSQTQKEIITYCMISLMWNLGEKGNA